MDTLYTCCCGLDVHLKTVVACLLKADGRKVHKQVRVFKTMTQDILALSDWLKAGFFKPHPAFMLTDHLAHLDYLTQAIERVEAEIEQRLQPVALEVALLDTIPGISQQMAHMILAEIGTDLTRFPSARHLASWASLCPGNNESAGKRYSRKTRKGSPYLRTA